MQSKENFEQELSIQIDEVFANYPELWDHRHSHPWLTGSLGDPYSGIWFLAESPSRSKIEATTERALQRGREFTPNMQWGETKGSQIFRKALVKAGLKKSEWNSPDGWHCYVTNVIKEAVRVKEWKKKSKTEAAEIWSPVLRWQLEKSAPKMVVVMGGQVEKLVLHLKRKGMICLPPLRRIHHYSYIASRAEGKLGPMHPDRIRRYEDSVSDIRREFEETYR